MGQILATGWSLIQYFGMASSKKHMESILKMLAKNCDMTPAEVVSKFPFLVMGFDSSMKMENLKCQKGGKSSDNHVGTCRIIIEPRLPPDPTDATFWFEINEGPPEEVTVVDQLIPAPPQMLPFETFNFEDNEFLESMYQAVGDHVVVTREMLYGEASDDEMNESYSFNWKDMRPTDGTRVNAYCEYLQLAQIAKSMKRHISGPKAAAQLSLTEDPRALAVLAVAHDNRDLLLAMSNFQAQVARSWNPHVEKVNKIMFPPMSQYPENTILGCGAVFIELAIDAGLIVPTGEKDCPLALQDGHEYRTFLVAGDCLSIDFLASFQRKIDQACMESHTARYETKKVLQMLFNLLGRSRVIGISASICYVSS
jgi:hypothetical protein